MTGLPTSPQINFLSDAFIAADLAPAQQGQQLPRQ
jgi:hypothetical protein